MGLGAYKSIGASAELFSRVRKRAHDVKRDAVLRTDASQLLELLLEVTAEGILGLDAEGRCVFTNDSAAAMLGYPAEHLHGKRILDLIQVAGDESRIKRRDGSWLLVRAFSFPWHRGSHATGSIFVFQDLSEQARLEKKLREAGRRYCELFDHVASGVYQSSPEGELLAVNPALVRLLGFESEQDLRAMDVKDLYLDPEERSKKISQLEREGFLRDVVLTLRRKDGAIIRVVENARSICAEDGRVLYYEGTLTPAND